MFRVLTADTPIIVTQPCRGDINHVLPSTVYRQTGKYRYKIPRFKGLFKYSIVYKHYSERA